MKGIPVNPFAIKRAEFLQFLGSPLLGRRVLYAADHGLEPWCRLLKTVRKGGRGSERLLDYESARACYEHIRDGHLPPPLPCERPFPRPRNDEPFSRAHPMDEKNGGSRGKAARSCPDASRSHPPKEIP